ncbi:transmembrane protein 50A [Chrysoperla carnea]|uniref:transmembrane protein 50A n=1 Tax=Chrysoperla carnea TaxID=189513 RepID=UPI001D066EF9|nr:transmembrane protein 50A [Chrysoperla carnea]
MDRLSGCCENMNLPPCVWFEGDKRNAYAAIVSGFMFFLGWWLLIDAAAVYDNGISNVHFVCGIIGTISLLMVNSVSNAQIRGDAYDGGCLGPRGARIWLFLGFVLGFASVIASCWILFANFVNQPNVKTYPGVALFLQCAFIFIGSTIFKFGRSEDLWG